MLKTKLHYKLFRLESQSFKYKINNITRTTPFSPTCMKIMDLFLQNPIIYYTPMTMFKSLDVKVNSDTIKNCMNILLQNNYLTKDDGIGTNHYNITKENMEFWVTDFRLHVLQKETKLQWVYQI